MKDENASPTPYRTFGANAHEARWIQTMSSTEETKEAYATPVSPKLDGIDSEIEGVENEQESKEVARSRLPEIWEYYMAQLQRIDELEKRLDEKVTFSRRRVQSILDQTPSYRSSHLRMFVTHKLENELPNQSDWTLVIEGKLLVGLLDHQCAARVDKEGALSSAREDSAESYIPSAASTATAAAASGADSAVDAGNRDRYQKVGDHEEDPINPIFFTHLFDKMEVIFQTVYQPKTPPRASMSPPKKSRSTKRKAEKIDPNSVSSRDLRASDPTKIVWTKNNSPDANAFLVNYSDHYSERPTPPGMKFHSVTATITLHPTRPETLYKPSPALAEKLFPRHRENLSSRGHDPKRKKTGEGQDDSPPPIILENDIRFPSLLKMKEITTALYHYIREKKLQDETEKSIILFDKTLSDLFECESLNFSELQAALLSKNLISPVGPEDSPIVLTYVMKKDTVSPQEPTANKSLSAVGDEVFSPTVVSFDMDVAVPSLFHYRSREMMRKIKKREFEYTSSRTKARYLLVASRGNEDIVKTKIEQAVSGQGYAEENIPVFLALAKAAPPNSEARVAAQIEAKTCSLVQRLEECSRQAEAAWELVDACKGLASKR
eukprot:scaffold24796_cov211-Cylindrotheca_fusiformis.AAC.2